MSAGFALAGKRYSKIPRSAIYVDESLNQNYAVRNAVPNYVSGSGRVSIIMSVMNPSEFAGN